MFDNDNLKVDIHHKKETICYFCGNLSTDYCSICKKTIPRDTYFLYLKTGHIINHICWDCGRFIHSIFIFKPYKEKL